jgi:predicted amidohydrolase YtcJ
MAADLVLTNGNIITMNPSQPRAQAVAVTKDRILKVGTNNEIAPLIGKNTKTLDLKGKTVVPGFIDTHIHVADFGRTLAWLDLKGTNSIRALQTLVKEKTAKTTRGKWILGSGWNQEIFKEKRLPRRQDLDAAAPDNPVILYHQLGRTGAANSKALELAGVTKDTVAPEDGVIERNPETCEPTGILQGNATDLVWNVVPAPTEAETVEAAKVACTKIVEAGITSVHWIALSAAELGVAQKLKAENTVPLRFFVIATAEVFETLPTSEETKPKIDAVLAFADGYLASQTAALEQSYVGDSFNRGQLLYTQDELNRLAARICKANLQVIIHAMGDEAVDAALKALETLSRAQSLIRRRHRLEQAAVLSQPLIKRIRNSGIVVSVQPKVVESEFQVWSAVEHLGEKRARMLFPLKTLMGKGVCVAGGSDCPMEPLSPLAGIQSAMTRAFYPKERLTFEEALGLYTVNAASLTLEENEKGSVEEGKLADLAVLSCDPSSVPSGKLSEVEVEMTVIGGRVCYQKPAS